MCDKFGEKYAILVLSAAKRVCQVKECIDNWNICQVSDQMRVKLVKRIDQKDEIMTFGLYDKFKKNDSYLKVVSEQLKFKENEPNTYTEWTVDGIALNICTTFVRWQASGKRRADNEEIINTKKHKTNTHASAALDSESDTISTETTTKKLSTAAQGVKNAGEQAHHVLPAVGRVIDTEQQNIKVLLESADKAIAAEHKLAAERFDKTDAAFQAIETAVTALKAANTAESTLSARRHEEVQDNASDMHARFDSHMDWGKQAVESINHSFKQVIADINSNAYSASTLHCKIEKLRSKVDDIKDIFQTNVAAQLQSKDAQFQAMLHAKNAQLKDKDTHYLILLHEKDVQLKDKDKQLEEKNMQWQTLLDARDVQLNSKDIAMTEMSISIAVLKTQLQDADKVAADQLKAFEKERADKDARFAEIQGNLSSEQVSVDGQKASLSIKFKEIKMLEQKIKEKDASISRLQAEIAVLRHFNKTLQDALKDANKQASVMLEKMLAANDKTISVLKAEIDELKKVVSAAVERKD